MGTILNISKDARKNIKETEQVMDDSIVAMRIEDEVKKPAIVFFDLVMKSRDAANSTIRQIKDVMGQLEKDSDKIPFYQEKLEKMEGYLKNTEWVLNSGSEEEEE